MQLERRVGKVGGGGGGEGGEGKADHTGCKVSGDLNNSGWKDD